MFNFASNTSWTYNNGCDSTNTSNPITFQSDQTCLISKPCLSTTNILKQQHHYNNYECIVIPQAADDHTVTIDPASPFSSVYFPPPFSPLFEDQNSTIYQHFEHHQTHISLVTNTIETSPHHHHHQHDNPVIRDQPTAKSDGPGDATNTNSVIPTVTVHIPMTKGSGIGRSSKRNNTKDRHSKIVTSSRPRHRRMRLSIDVARQFFDLQETLGFDRASKTVEWLLVHARPHITKLHCNSNSSPNSSPSNSDCEVISGIDQEPVAPADTAIIIPCLKPKRKYNRRSARQLAAVPRRSSFDPAARQARAMARKRARKRTIEKNLLLGVSIDSPQLHHQLADHHGMIDPDHPMMMCRSLDIDHDHLYGPRDLGGLLIGVAEENNHDLAMITNSSAATPMIQHLDQYRTDFLNAEKQHCNHSLLYNLNNNSPHNSTTVLGYSRIQQEQHQRNLDCQFLAKAWNQVNMSSSQNMC